MRFRRSKPLLHHLIRAFCAFLVLCGTSWPTLAGDTADPQPMTAILLVARDQLHDPNFHKSVVLVLNDIGAGPAGVIINRPTSIAVSRLFPDLENRTQPQDRVYFGGPVDVRSVSFLFRADALPEHATRVIDGVYLSSDRHLLHQLLSRDKPMDGLRILIGYSGWTPAQLEGEIARGDWSLQAAKADAIFDGKSDYPWPEQQEPGHPTALKQAPSQHTGRRNVL